MITRHVRGSVTWVDIESPTKDEIFSVMGEFHVDSRVAEELLRDSPYPFVVSTPDYLYMIIHFPTAGQDGSTKSQEIDIIVGKHFLITSRNESINSIHALHKAFEAEELLSLPVVSNRADALLERVLRHLYGALREEIETIGHQLDHIERDIFAGRERETVHTISQVNRMLLRFDMTIGRHAESLSSLLSELAMPQFFGKVFMERATRIDAEREHVATLVGSYRDVASELRNTNDSLLSASQNEVMKTLTVINFVILPMTLITDLFHMNAQDVPFADLPNSFWIIVGLEFVVSCLILLYAKRKKWL